MFVLKNSLAAGGGIREGCFSDREEPGLGRGMEWMNLEYRAFHFWFHNETICLSIITDESSSDFTFGLLLNGVKDK